MSRVHLWSATLRQCLATMAAPATLLCLRTSADARTAWSSLSTYRRTALSTSPADLKQYHGVWEQLCSVKIRGHEWSMKQPCRSMPIGRYLGCLEQCALSLSPTLCLDSNIVHTFSDTMLPDHMCVSRPPPAASYAAAASTNLPSLSLALAYCSCSLADVTKAISG